MKTHTENLTAGVLAGEIEQGFQLTLTGDITGDLIVDIIEDDEVVAAVGITRAGARSWAERIIEALDAEEKS